MDEVAKAFITQARALLDEDYLPKIERCLERLSESDVWWRANSESNSIGNLLLHLAGNARQWIISGIGGSVDERVRQLEFDERSPIPHVELLAHLKQTIFEVDSVLARLDPSSMLERRVIQGNEVTVIEAIFHVVEHFSMHTGQIILITKILKTEDLKFYDFSSGASTPNWQRGE